MRACKGGSGGKAAENTGKEPEESRKNY
jgi:hypothetical protein